MTTPLIIQIQEAALDSKASITDALRKAKVACSKLHLGEFGNWVNAELDGYANKNTEDLPNYRKVRGVPQAFNPYRGWAPIVFKSVEQQTLLSVAPIGMSIAGIEASLCNISKNPDGHFVFPYPPAIEKQLRDALTYGDHVQMRIDVAEIREIIHAVRNIVLDWTLSMEREGVRGDGLIFSSDEEKASVAATANTVNNFNIGQVGALVQNADRSFVQGSSATTINVEDVRQFIQQVEQLLPAAKLEQSVDAEARSAIDTLKDATQAEHSDNNRIRKGLEA